MYRIKICLGIPLDNSTSKDNIMWKMMDLGYTFTDYIDCKKFVDRLITINGTDNTAIDFWISTEENTQS